jgi:hypothetical protein
MFALSGALSEALGSRAVYEASIRRAGESVVLMAREEERDVLAAAGPAAAAFKGEPFGREQAGVLAPLTGDNADALRRLFPFAAPVPALRKPRSIGLGDRLGLATPGHIRALKGYDASPVFAQQSVRELTLTGRAFADVLNAATFSVFREGFERGFGFDGDHLKTEAEVSDALAAGCTMITLDCSEYIRSGEPTETGALPGQLRTRYLGRRFALTDTIEVVFDDKTLGDCQRIYGEALDFAAAVYDRFLRDKTGRVDFELSIDETAAPTTPAQHFFVANELALRDVKPVTLAPRFCGEFQKGVDYIGDLSQFAAEMDVHAAIAAHFGYKLSIHSGSDKFSVFPTIGRATQGRFHVKTAGTNWLSAMQVVAETDPALYRAAHKHALARFADARTYYHVTTDLRNIPDLDALADKALPKLFANRDARQLIHITYGCLLTDRGPDGAPLLRDRLYRLWDREAELYARRLAEHIGKHLALLYGEGPGSGPQT